jgi:glycosyltransferase involved in cell wall biosynthesis
MRLVVDPMIRTVLHFIDGSAVGGTELTALQIMTGLDRALWRPILLHHDEPGLAKLLACATEHGIEHCVVPRMETIRDLHLMHHFWRRVANAGASVFHAHLTWPLSCKYGLLVAALARVPAIVATAHTRLPIRKSLQGQPRLIARLVHRYMAVSRSVASHLRTEFGIDARKVEVVYDGIDLNEWDRERAPATRDALLGGKTGPLVITVARLADGKGHLDLLAAARQVPDAVFVLVGDGPLRALLESEASNLGVADRVRFLGERQDVPGLLACADLFVLPSLSEGLGVCLLESMAAGVPIVATAIGGIDEVIEASRTGLLVPPATPSAIADAIVRLWGDPLLARTLTAAARETVRERFDAKRMVSHVTRVYDEVLAL